jgi:hypothetical protein
MLLREGYISNFTYATIRLLNSRTVTVKFLTFFWNVPTVTYSTVFWLC